MGLIIHLAGLAGLCLFDAALADDDAVLRNAQLQAAQIVTIARTAQLLCAWIEANDEAIRGLMDHVQITDRDVMDPDRFGGADRDVALSFKQSVQAEPDFCAEVYTYPGEGGIHLLRRKPGGPG